MGIVQHQEGGDMSFLWFVTAAVVLVVVIFGIMIVQSSNTAARVRAMSPGDRATYTFGAVNDHLICTHCQTKGLVRAKRAMRIAVATGTVGGILKTNTTSQTTVAVTQHHCDQCATTWDV